MNATKTPTPVILCADDFGISPGVDRAIIDLAARGRLSAVTCMSLGPAWREDAGRLKATGVSAGLHLTLTHLPPMIPALGPRHGSAGALGLKSWARVLDKALIEQELQAQFIRFIEVWGAPPDFIDGHQHVHTLPVVRDIVLRLRRAHAPKSWVRNVSNGFYFSMNIKSLILSVMGWRLRGLLVKDNIRFNQYMLGPYDYDSAADFSALMDAWVSTGVPALIYCHPGIPDAALARVDTVLAPRQREYDFLRGDVFGAWIGTRITLVKAP